MNRAAPLKETPAAPDGTAMGADGGYFGAEPLRAQSLPADRSDEQTPERPGPPPEPAHARRPVVDPWSWRRRWLVVHAVRVAALCLLLAAVVGLARQSYCGAGWGELTDDAAGSEQSTGDGGWIARFC